MTSHDVPLVELFYTGNVINVSRHQKGYLYVGFQIQILNPSILCPRRGDVVDTQAVPSLTKAASPWYHSEESDPVWGLRLGVLGCASIAGKKKV